MRRKFDLLSSNIHFWDQGKGKVYSVTPCFTNKKSQKT